MEIFQSIQPKCPRCGTFLKKDFYRDDPVGGTAPLPSGSSANIFPTYGVEPEEAGIRLSCPNCGYQTHQPFASFD